jgi:hypothetical protein
MTLCRICVCWCFREEELHRHAEEDAACVRVLQAYPPCPAAYPRNVGTRQRQLSAEPRPTSTLLPENV